MIFGKNKILKGMIILLIFVIWTKIPTYKKFKHFVTERYAHKEIMLNLIIKINIIGLFILSTGRTNYEEVLIEIFLSSIKIYFIGLNFVYFLAFKPIKQIFINKMISFLIKKCIIKSL